MKLQQSYSGLSYNSQTVLMELQQSYSAWNYNSLAVHGAMMPSRMNGFLFRIVLFLFSMDFFRIFHTNELFFVQR